MQHIRSEDTERHPEQKRPFSPAFVGAVCDRVCADGTVSAKDVQAVLAAAGDESALRAALGPQRDDVADLGAALTLLQDRGFSQTAEAVRTALEELKRELAEARAALVAAEARGTSEPRPLENGAFLAWWETAGRELLTDVSVHDAALIFHAGADLVVQRDSRRLEEWMVRAAMRIALPHLDEAVPAKTPARAATPGRTFEGLGFAAQTLRRALGETEEAAAAAAAAKQPDAEPVAAGARAQVEPRRKRSFGERLREAWVWYAHGIPADPVSAGLRALRARYSR